MFILEYHIGSFEYWDEYYTPLDTENRDLAEIYAKVVEINTGAFICEILDSMPKLEYEDSFQTVKKKLTENEMNEKIEEFVEKEETLLRRIRSVLKEGG